MTDAQFLDTAKRLIQIKSTTDRPEDLHAALKVMEHMLHKTHGVTVEKFEDDGKPSLLAYFGKKRPERFAVLFNGHVDVVPARDDQFEPYIKDDKLFGRGALDMKVAALLLTDVFCKVGKDAEYPLGLQIVTDEEVGGAHGTKYQIDQGVAADFVIAGEFTPAAAICNESRGICWAEVTLRGTTAHSAYLWNGVNAVLQANGFAVSLLKHYPIPDHDEWVTTANIASINTPNTTLNRVPDEATLKLDIRYVADDENFRDETAAKAFLQSLDPSAKVNILTLEPSHFADPAGKTLLKLARASEKVTGQKTTFIRKHGAADVRYYSARGDQAVVLGLSGENLHGDNEYLELSSIERYRRILEEFLATVA